MIINTDVFEKLLFPLHKKAYEGINQIIEEIKTQNSDIINEIISTYELEHNAYYKKNIGEGKKQIPVLNILVCYQKNEDLTINNVYKSSNCYVSYTFEYPKIKGIALLPTSDVIIRFYHNKIEQNFILPIAFILGFNKKKILSNQGYQVYTHQLYPMDDINERNEQIKKGNYNNFEKTKVSAYTYIGITKRNWKKRYQEHLNDSRNGSYIRFHRFLRGEFFQIGAIDHIIDKAGITEEEAMEIEEKNVEQQSLYPFFSKGLNMIPGGKAGLKCIHEYAKRTGYKIDGKLEADIFESELLKIQNQMLQKIAEDKDCAYKNAKLAELWANDIDFRIKAITNQANHFSYTQIQAARMLLASGWDFDKIYEYITKIDDTKSITKERLTMLLNGVTYKSIPDVLL